MQDHLTGWRAAIMLFNLITGALGTLVAMGFIVTASLQSNSIDTLYEITSSDNFFSLQSFFTVVIGVGVGFDLMSTMRLVVAYGLWRDRLWAIPVTITVHMAFLIAEVVAFLFSLFLWLVPVMMVVVVFMLTNIILVVKLWKEEGLETSPGGIDWS